MIKSVSVSIGHEAKELKGGVIGKLSGALVAGLLGKMLAVKGIIRAGDGIIRADKKLYFCLIS